MRKLLYLLIISALVLSVSSCSSDDGVEPAVLEGVWLNKTRVFTANDEKFNAMAKTYNQYLAEYTFERTFDSGTATLIVKNIKNGVEQTLSRDVSEYTVEGDTIRFFDPMTGDSKGNAFFKLKKDIPGVKDELLTRQNMTDVELNTFLTKVLAVGSGTIVPKGMSVKLTAKEQRD